MTEAVTKELCNLTGLYFDKSEAIYKEIVQNVKQFDVSAIILDNP